VALGRRIGAVLYMARWMQAGEQEMTLDEWTRTRTAPPMTAERLEEILCWYQRHSFAADSVTMRVVRELLLEVARLRKEAEQ